MLELREDFDMWCNNNIGTVIQIQAEGPNVTGGAAAAQVLGASIGAKVDGVIIIIIGSTLPRPAGIHRRRRVTRLIGAHESSQLAATAS